MRRKGRNLGTSRRMKQAMRMQQILSQRCFAIDSEYYADIARRAPTKRKAFPKIVDCLSIAATSRHVLREHYDYEEKFLALHAEKEETSVAFNMKF